MKKTLQLGFSTFLIFTVVLTNVAYSQIWKAKYNQFGTMNFSSFQPTNTFISNGTMQLPVANSPYSSFFTIFSNDIELCVGDTFTYETRFQNNQATGGITAYDCHASIVGENGAMHITMFDNNPVGINNIQYTNYGAGGDTIYGQMNLIQDLEEWGVLRILSSPSSVKFIFRDSLLFDHAVSASIGKITHLEFWLKGSAPVDYVKIWDSENELIYNENFDDVNFEPSIPCLPNSTDDLNKNLQEIVSLYPNPASEVFQVKVPDNLVGKDVEIQIVNYSGEIIFRQNKTVLGNTEIMIDKIPSGFYIVNIIGENWNVVKKMIKI